MPRPTAVSVLAVVQFLVAGVACIVLLGERNLDSELDVVDYLIGVAAAIVGAVVVGSSWNGGRIGYWLQVVLALGAAGVGVWRVVEGDPPIVVAIAALWLVVLLVPTHRRWLTTNALA